MEVEAGVEAAAILIFTVQAARAPRRPIAIVHERWSWARGCPGAPSTVCDYRDSHTDFAELVFYPGARFMLSDTAGFTVRLGFPHVTLGVSLLL